MMILNRISYISQTRNRHFRYEETWKKYSKPEVISDPGIRLEDLKSLTKEERKKWLDVHAEFQRSNNNDYGSAWHHQVLTKEEREKWASDIKKISDENDYGVK